ncbi:polysaccharide deacetylase family protein [Aegicerativicinus sediminis]
MLLVYTHNITPRLRYIFKQVCTKILGITVDYTTSEDDFISYNGMKMSYSKQALGQELYIRSHDLLFEQGLEDVEIVVQSWGGTKCFFQTSDKSDLPFDIFAASFYMLCRYEEYLPHVKDDYGRYPAKESLGFKHGFMQEPVVDIWAYRFKDVLKAFYPEYDFPIRQYQIQPIIDVPMAFYFKQKGFLRIIGGSISDLVRLKLKNFYQRYLSIMGFVRDPYDTFKWIITKQRHSKVKFLVFFLVGDYSTYDKNISVNKKQFISAIKSVADYCKVGLKLSYFAIDDLELLKKEKKKLEAITNFNVEASRNSHSKVNLPETYRNLLAMEIRQDYTMGYLNEIGFRAGTCTPFPFYDLDYEMPTPLQIHPYNCIDFALLKHLSLLDKKQVLQRLMDNIKAVDGTFIPIFHNYSFSNEPRWKGFRALFNQILKSVEDESEN